MADVRLKWPDTFIFLFSALLLLADMATDILTAVLYKTRDQNLWFIICVTLIAFPSFITCCWSCVASNFRQTYSENVSSALVVLDGCFFSCCLGPVTSNLKLFAFCVGKFKELWKNVQGIIVPEDDEVTSFLGVLLFSLYNDAMNLRVIQGFLETAPQLILQSYVIISSWASEIHIVQVVSIIISFINIVWLVTSYDISKEYRDLELKWQHKASMLLLNFGIQASRFLAITVFVVSFRWWLLAVIGFHWLTVIFMGCFVWSRSERTSRSSHLDVFIVLHVPLFTFMRSLNKFHIIRASDSPMPLSMEIFISCVWNLVFACENLLMAFLVYLKLQTNWYALPGLIVVVLGTFCGALSLVFDISLYRWRQKEHELPTVGRARVGTCETWIENRPEEINLDFSPAQPQETISDYRETTQSTHNV